MVLDEDVLLEIVRPGTGDPVAPGEVGEVVVTSFSPEYPLIRFGTGDLSVLLPGISPCGRTNTRIKRLAGAGRPDYQGEAACSSIPGQVAAVLKRHPELGRGRLVVDNPDHNDRMTLHCEAASPAEGLAEAVAARSASSPSCAAR